MVNFSQELGQTQSLTMTPRLQQALKFLTLTHLEMSNVISREMVENPMLEEISEGIEGGVGQSRGPYERSNYENIVSREKTLAEHLASQFRMEDKYPTENKVAKLIIYNINEDGHLDISFDDLVAQSGEKRELCLKVCEEIKKLDPVGCGSENLKDCLLTQAKISGNNSPLLENIIKNHLEDVGSSNVAKLAREMGHSPEVIRSSLLLLQNFHPRPGRLISPELTHYIIPDIYVSWARGKLEVSINNEGIPRLRIAQSYKEILHREGRESAREKEFVKKKLRSAQWLMKSVERRKNILYKTTRAILERQGEFFKRRGSLVPMILKDIAADVGVHESTVSRVTTNKYMHTPLGLFELKYFFGAVGHREASVSGEVLKMKIRELCRYENPKRPFSDRKIVELLEREGIKSTVRTVARYREKMGIAPSSRRKKS